GVRPAPPGVAKASVSVAETVQSELTMYVPTWSSDVSGVELENMPPLPSRYTLPTEAKAAEFVTPAVNAPICVVLPLIAVSGVVGTNATGLLPLHPKPPSRSAFPLQVRACTAGAIARTPLTIRVLTQVSLCILSS